MKAEAKQMVPEELKWAEVRQYQNLPLDCIGQNRQNPMELGENQNPDLRHRQFHRQNRHGVKEENGF